MDHRGDLTTRRRGFSLQRWLNNPRFAPGAATLFMAALTLTMGLSLVLSLVALGFQLSGGAGPALLLAATWGAGLSIVCWIVNTVFAAGHYGNLIKIQGDLDELLGMTEALQSAESYEDTATVLAATSLELLPGFGGALYVFNNSRDRLDLAGHWNLPVDHVAADTLSPSNCWTLKRGKTHINRPNSQRLRCAHHTGAAATLEVPMIARGSVYGLLIFVTADDDQVQQRFENASRLAQAMAEAMSLALSNISLREKLRTQSLRDPLTGLYNRRYMEDALERFVSLAERSGAATSVLMFDLDNFKRLNDEHGHAKGDAVLRDVAAQIVGGVRPSDVVCRYGGEELLVILPDCPLDDAKLKAEALRLRIEGLSEVHGVAVSASIGVATIPHTSTTVADLVAMADGALYSAKTGGKNRVVCAKLRSGPAPKPALAA